MTGAVKLIVRRATDRDIPAITRIYNEGIVDRLATLETQERTEAERLAWLQGRDERHPVFVAAHDTVVLGWSSLNVFNARPAYHFVVDLSVYIAREARGKGIGTTLLRETIAAARRLGYHKMVLAGFPFNDAGLALYRKLGFREVGVYREQGVLDGRWVDTVIMELLLDDAPPPLDPR